MYEVFFSNGVSIWIIRLPTASNISSSRHSHSIYHDTMSQRFISSKTSTASIHHWSLDVHTVLSRLFIIFKPRTNLSKVWNSWIRTSSARGYSSTERLARWMTELRVIVPEFNQIGCLGFDGTSGTYGVVPDGEQEDTYPAGPFDTMHFFLSFLLSME